MVDQSDMSSYTTGDWQIVAREGKKGLYSGVNWLGSWRGTSPSKSSGTVILFYGMQHLCRVYRDRQSLISLQCFYGTSPLARNVYVETYYR